MKKEDVEKLIDSHWMYVKSLLVFHKVAEREIEIAEFYYKTAMEHGFFHGYESATNPMKKLWDNPEDEAWNDMEKKIATEEKPKKEEKKWVGDL